MPSLTVKNIPDAVYQRLKVDAARNQRSLNSEILVRLERSTVPAVVQPDEFIAAVAAFQRSLPGKPLSRAATDRAKKAGRP
jgi:plasmid stability protein